MSGKTALERLNKKGHQRHGLVSFLVKPFQQFFHSNQDFARSFRNSTTWSFNTTLNFSISTFSSGDNYEATIAALLDWMGLPLQDNFQYSHATLH